MKIKNELDEKFLTAIIIVSIVAFPLLELIGVIFEIQFFLQEDYLSCVGFVWSIFMVIYIILCKFKKNCRPKKIVLSDVFIILSIIFCIISIVTSKIPELSIRGMRNYSETPLQVLGYFGLFFICTLVSDEKYRKSIFYTFLVLGIFESVVAFMQNFKMWPTTSFFDPSWHTNDHLAFGFTQHCNFFAPIAIIFTALFSMKFMYSKKALEKIICVIGILLCCSSALFTYTRIAWVGLFAILLGIVILEISIFIKNKDKELIKNHIIKYIVVAVCILSCFFIIGNSSGQIEKDVAQSQKEITSVKTEKKVESFGTGRGFIWKAGILALKKYPFTGVGFDLYNYSFFASGSKLSMQNKGHNEYLHTAVTQGIFSGINYLLFAFYCCYFPLRKILKGDTDFGKSNLTKFFLVALFAYFVQALFNSSVTNVAVYKWMLMGLLLPRVEQKELHSTWEKIKSLSKKEINFKNKNNI